MFCTNCGNKIEESDKFCTKCGNLSTKGQEQIITKAAPTRTTSPILSEDKWWQRLLKVGYIFLCLQILWIVPVVWSVNSSTYVGYSYGQSSYKDTPDEAFWYSVLAILIFMVATRLLKITVLYVAMGKKPNWTSEFKKLY
jgi:ABC-type Fe3+ transport system permease subunit